MDRLQGGRLAEAQRDDERHRPRLAVKRGVQRPAGLAQGEVQGRRVKRPAAIQARDLAALGGHREQVEGVDALAELAQRIVAGEVEHRAGLLQGDVVGGVVDDVLADARLAVSLQVHDRRQALETA